MWVSGAGRGQEGVGAIKDGMDKPDMDADTYLPAKKRLGWVPEAGFKPYNHAPVKP